MVLPMGDMVLPIMDAYVPIQMKVYTSQSFLVFLIISFLASSSAEKQ
jgi:hypothetical protein